MTAKLTYKVFLVCRLIRNGSKYGFTRSKYRRKIIKRDNHPPLTLLAARRPRTTSIISSLSNFAISSSSTLSNRPDHNKNWRKPTISWSVDWISMMTVLLLTMAWASDGVWLIIGRTRVGLFASGTTWLPWLWVVGLVRAYRLIEKVSGDWSWLLKQTKIVAPFVPFVHGSQCWACPAWHSRKRCYWWNLACSDLSKNLLLAITIVLL